MDYYCINTILCREGYLRVMLILELNDTAQEPNTTALASQVWKCNVPLKVQIFGLRLLFDRLPNKSILFIILVLVFSNLCSILVLFLSYFTTEYLF